MCHEFFHIFMVSASTENIPAIFLLKKSRITLQKSHFLWYSVWSCTPPLIPHFILQYHLSVPVKTWQELPCRLQVAHPQCGSSLGISAHLLTLPFPATSAAVVRCWNPDYIITVTSDPGVVELTVFSCCCGLAGKAGQVARVLNLV